MSIKNSNDTIGNRIRLVAQCLNQTRHRGTTWYLFHEDSDLSVCADCTIIRRTAHSVWYVAVPLSAEHENLSTRIINYFGLLCNDTLGNKILIPGFGSSCYGKLAAVPSIKYSETKVRYELAPLYFKNFGELVGFKSNAPASYSGR